MRVAVLGATGATGPPAAHSAHHSPRRTSITRADLAAFLADLVDRPGYVQQAPLVAGR